MIDNRGTRAEAGVSGGLPGDDSALVERLKAGDPRAADEMVGRYQDQLYAFILRMVENRTVADDIFQETWLRVIRSIRSFRGEARFSTWLFQIALNLSRNLMRQRARRSFVDIEEVETLVEEPDVDPVRILQAERVRKMIASLPVKMREVIVLRYYNEFKDDEIAEVTGLPPGTVKSRIHRATALLRKKIEATEKMVSNMEVE